MRLVAGLLALTLTGTLAFADEGKAPEPQPTQTDRARGKVGLRVVTVMMESQQALLFDKNRGTHVLADVGSVIGGYTVTSIDEDEVTLTAGGREIVLAAPDVAIPAKKPRAANTTAPADPYAAPEAEAAKPALTNPYDEATLDAANAPAPITTTEMEINPYSEPELTPEDKKGSVDDEGARAFADAMNGHVIVRGPDATPTAPAAPAADPATMVSRKELTAALGDFAGLTAAMRGAFTPAGARIDAVAPASVFAKAGLRNGDVVTAVDGRPLTSIDDAADLYIRAGSARTANVQLLRAGKPMTLRLAIQ